jgi:hypothetical protein
MDTWILALKHWENTDSSRVSIRMLTPFSLAFAAQESRNTPSTIPNSTPRATFWAIKY